MALQFNTRREQNLSTSAMNKIFISSEKHFFATSHRNGPEDGRGGMVKRLAAKRSLQKVYNNQIRTLHNLFNYCSCNIHNITFFYVQEHTFKKI
jgi:hypothetical protein